MTVLAVTAVALAGAARAEGAITGENGRIAFERHAAGQSDVYVAGDPADGPSAVLNVTPGTPASSELNPAWERQFDVTGVARLAFDSNRAVHGGGDVDREIYVLTFDPSVDGPLDLEVLTDNGGANDSEPVWAADWPPGSPSTQTVGALLAFVRDGDIVIRTLGSPEPVETNVTASPAVEASPEWAPYGGQLAFERTAPDGRREIRVMRVTYIDDPTGPDRFALSDPRDVTPGQPPSLAPSWYRFFVLEGSGAPAAGDQEGPTQPSPIEPGPCESEMPMCFPAVAERIAFAGPDEQGDDEIYFASYEEVDPERPFAEIGGIETWQLTDNTSRDAAPAWAPTGQFIVFQSNRTGRSRVYWMAQDGGDPLDVNGVHPRPLLVPTDPQGEDRNPAWQALPVAASVTPRRPCGRFSTRRRCRRASRAASVPGVRSVVPPTCTAPCTRSGAARRCTHLGTRGNDKLVGDRRRNILCGRGGRDRIFGRGGPDTLLGGAGSDRLSGGSGNDRLDGGAGPDSLSGGPGFDRLFGGPGGDRLNSHDTRRDLVSGGPGRDTAKLDRRRDSARGIERRRP
jgi:hypothetical protein